MMNNLHYCCNCAGKIVVSLQEHYEEKGRHFCCEQCAETYFAPKYHNCKGMLVDETQYVHKEGKIYCCERCADYWKQHTRS